MSVPSAEGQVQTPHVRTYDLYRNRCLLSAAHRLIVPEHQRPDCSCLFTCFTLCRAPCFATKLSPQLGCIRCWNASGWGWLHLIIHNWVWPFGLTSALLGSFVTLLSEDLNEKDLHHQSPTDQSVSLHSDLWLFYRYTCLTKTVGLTTYFYKITSFFWWSGLDHPLVQSTNHSFQLLCHFLAWCIKSFDSPCKLAITVGYPWIYSMTLCI